MRTPMPVFSSAQYSGPSVGGFKSNSMMATAFSANSGSRSFIQESNTVQAQLMTLQNDTHDALTRRTGAQLRTLADVLRQCLDGPVCLPSPSGVHFAWFF